MRNSNPGTFVRDDTLRLARDGKFRMALVADVMHTCDLWLEDAQEVITGLIADGKLIEEEREWIRTAPATTVSRSGATYSPYRKIREISSRE